MTTLTQTWDLLHLKQGPYHETTVNLVSGHQKHTISLISPKWRCESNIRLYQLSMLIQLCKPISLVPRPRLQGGKGSGTHRALYGAHKMQHITWLAWQCIVLAWQHIVLAWQRINRSHTHTYTARGWCHMIITWCESDWCARIPNWNVIRGGWKCGLLFNVTFLMIAVFRYLPISRA